MSDLGWEYLEANDKRQILEGIKDGVAYGGPYHVEIHPADRCNIDCFFCSTAALRGTDEIPVPRFQTLLDELRSSGVRSIRLSGGGEPLFHRRIREVLLAIVQSRIPIENLTTNAVLVNDEVVELLTACCDQVTVSLNTADESTYATMMQTPARNFHRVLTNIRALVNARKKHGRPRINLQYLVWRENYRTIPAMYALARDLGVDTVLFSGLAFLSPEQKMTDSEVQEMLVLYEGVVREDEFRRITNIGSFERDIQTEVDAMIHRLARERTNKGIVKRTMHFLTRRDYSLRDKLRHRKELHERERANRLTAEFEESCIIAWHSMLIRSDGAVAPCCILQKRNLGNVFANTVHDVWHGKSYQTLRAELTTIIREREAWESSPNDRFVDTVCGLRGSELCPMKSFYFRGDVPFVHDLQDLFLEAREARSPANG